MANDPYPIFAYKHFEFITKDFSDQMTGTFIKLLFKEFENGHLTENDFVQAWNETHWDMNKSDFSKVQEQFSEQGEQFKSREKIFCGAYSPFENKF